MIAVQKEKNEIGFVPNNLYFNSTALSISRVRIFKAILREFPDTIESINITAKLVNIFIAVLLPRYNIKIKILYSIDTKFHNT